MGRLNNVIKMVVLVLNSCFSVLSLVAIAFAAYILGNDWEDLDPSFYEWVCGMTITLGCLTFILSMVGCCGVIYQEERTGQCTGRKMLSFFEVSNVLAVVAIAVLLVQMLETRNSLQAVIDADGSVTYDRFEERMSDKFNQLYFQARESDSGEYSFFTEWINDHCPFAQDEAADVNDCSGYWPIQGGDDDADSFAESFAGRFNFCDKNNVDNADWNDATQCYGGDDDEAYGYSACKCAPEEGAACYTPYDLCRTQICNRMIGFTEPLQDYLLVFGSFYLFLTIMTCLLICYSPRDNISQMLIKAGTFAYVQAPSYQINEPRVDAEMVFQNRPAQQAVVQGIA